MRQHLNWFDVVIIFKIMQILDLNHLNKITLIILLNKGAIVTLACRDTKRAQDACDRIKAETKSEKVFVEQLDLGDLKSVRNFAKTFISKSNRLDILVNNAGILIQYL